MELTEERLAEIERYLEGRRELDWKDVPGEAYVADVGALVAEVRRLRALAEKTELLWEQLSETHAETNRLGDEREEKLKNDLEEARGLAREYLYGLEEVGIWDTEKEKQVYPWLLEPEPATATGVAEAVFGIISEADSDSGSSSGWVKP